MSKYWVDVDVKHYLELCGQKKSAEKISDDSWLRFFIDWDDLFFCACYDQYIFFIEIDRFQ